MGSTRRWRVALLTVALSLAGIAPLAAQTQSSPSQQPPASPPTGAAQATPPSSLTSPDVTPNLDRIRSAIAKPATLKVEDGKLRFYVEVVAKWPTFKEFVGDYDLRNGPTRGGPMTHQEFLNLVTPRDFYGSAGIKATEMLQFALVNWLGQELAKKAIESFREARDERALREIRERIERELAALKGKGDK